MSNHDTTDMWTTQFEMGYMRKKTGDEMKKAILNSYNPNPSFYRNDNTLWSIDPYTYLTP